MSLCQMISTYHDDLLRKLAKRYQAPLSNHNILMYPEWHAFLSLTFVQGILHNGRAVYPFTPPQPKGASFAPDCLSVYQIFQNFESLYNILHILTQLIQTSCLVTHFCAQAVFKVPFSNTFPTHKTI